MTRADLVVNMAKAAGWPKAGTGARPPRVLIAIRASLRRGDPITLVGFGTFSVARPAPPHMRNPKTGRTVTVAGRIPRSSRPRS